MAQQSSENKGDEFDIEDMITHLNDPFQTFRRWGSTFTKYARESFQNPFPTVHHMVHSRVAQILFISTLAAGLTATGLIKLSQWTAEENQRMDDQFIQQQLERQIKEQLKRELTPPPPFSDDSTSGLG